MLIGIKSQRFLGRGELDLRLAFAGRFVPVFIFVIMLESRIHVRQAGLGSLLKYSGKSFSRAMQLPAHRVGGLFSEMTDLIVA
jgi:hypothetical protein